MCKKVGGMIGILRRLKNLVHAVNARLLLYKSAIHSATPYLLLQDILILMFKVKNKLVMT